MQKSQNHRELFNWARLVGEKNEFVVTTAKSSYGKKEFLKLGCERRGKYQLSVESLREVVQTVT